MERGERGEGKYLGGFGSGGRLVWPAGRPAMPAALDRFGPPGYPCEKGVTGYRSLIRRWTSLVVVPYHQTIYYGVDI